MPAKSENINDDNYKSYLLYIEFVQNELDPCWEIYHAPKIKTFIQKNSLFWSIIALEAWAMQKYEYLEEIKRSKCSTTSQKKNGQVSGSRIRGTPISTRKKRRRERKW